MSSSLQQLAADFYLTSIGAKGSTLAVDTTALTGEWRMLLALTDCTFTVLTTNVTRNGTVNMASVSDWGTIKAGEFVYAKITACTLASGKVQLFY